MKLHSSLLPITIASCLAIAAPKLIAQTATAIQLFGPVDVRGSQSGASNATPDIFNTNTLNLTCSQSPIIATLSSNSGGTGNVLVDNNIYVTDKTNSASPTNVCTGVGDGSPSASCFTTNYQAPAGAGLMNGDDPDTFSGPFTVNGVGYAYSLQSGGVPPIDISGMLSSGTQQLEIDLEDQGGYVANSSLYLYTNCTSGGVNGPAMISGNTIPPTNPTPVQLDQGFDFNPVTGNQIDFQYDLSGAYSANTLTTNSGGVNPQVGDSALEPTPSSSEDVSDFTHYVSGTSFATSMCLVHQGESLNGQPACKLFTLECTVGTDNTAAGANCPVSSSPNEVFQDVFDGPPFTLRDIPTSNNGPVFHEGMGFLMASEGWTPGPCQFDSNNPSSDLYNVPCPQNLLTSFTGPGGFTGSGQTTHPNSTFITIAQVPEDLTTVSVTDSQGNPINIGPGSWTNSTYVNLSSQPPNLTGTNLPGAANFVASPIKSITYGITPGTTPPVPGTTKDTAIINPVACPTPTDPDSPAATVFATGVQTLSPIADGQYLLHYYAQDCAGTKELKFINSNADGSTGTWSTNFYTIPINIDTTPPQVSGPTLSAPGPYYQGQPVTAIFDCTDSLSGVVSCGGLTFGSGGSGVSDTGQQTVQLNTSAGGTFTVQAVDAAGNKSSQSVTYQVSIDSQIQLTVSPGTITYPLGTNLTVKLTNINGHVPTGTVKIMERGTPLANLTLGSGAAYYYLSGLSAGTHYLTAVYSGDSHNAAGTSAQVPLNVLPVPVTLTLSCWNTPYPYGADFHCGVYASSAAGAPLGSITYAYDGGAPVSLPLASGSVSFIIPKPPVGTHNLVVSYPAQTNYAAAGPKNQSFAVTPAPVVVQFTPSAWYLTGGNLTLSASIQSWSAGPPNATGSVTFTYGSTVLSGAASPVSSSGVASITIPVSSLPNGSDKITATFSGGTNYATGSTSINVQVAH